MGDLRDYQATLYTLFQQFSKLKPSANYRQIRASGSESMQLRIKAGRISHFEMCSDLCVEALACDKRGSLWHVSSGVFPDFTVLTDWERMSARMETTTSRTDPRPPYHPSEQTESPQPPLRYDPEVARNLPAILFHRTYQTIAPILAQGIMADLTATHIHGACAWNNAPITFAWADNGRFYFDPHTAIEETICLYAPQKPHLKRHVCATTYRLTERPDLANIVEDLKIAQSAPLLAFTQNNIDHVILMPSAVITILRSILHDPGVLTLPSGLECVDSPEDSLFDRAGTLDSSGKPLATSPVTPKSAAILCPILRATAPIADPPKIEALSSQIPGRLLCIEHIEIQHTPSGTYAAYFPDGGILYRDGQFLAHVHIPARAWPLTRLLEYARPVSAPTRIGRLATCALETAL